MIGGAQLIAADQEAENHHPTKGYITMSEVQNDQIVVRHSVDLAAIAELEQALTTGKVPAGADADVDPELITQEIIRQLLAAQSDEELERLEAEGWANFVGVPFEVLDFAWRPSSFDEGMPVFLVVRAMRMDDGSPHVLTTGSGQVMAQLANLAKRGSLPAIRELVGNATKAGNTVYTLKTPDSIAEERRKATLAVRAGGGEQTAPGDA